MRESISGREFKAMARQSGHEQRRGRPLRGMKAGICLPHGVRPRGKTGEPRQRVRWIDSRVYPKQDQLGPTPQP